MIPLKDNIPHRRLPVITTFLLLVNILVFIYQHLLRYEILERLIYIYGFVPQRIFMPDISFRTKIISLFTSMFMHANFLHLFGNCLYLWIFADNVEDRLGHLNFLIFYLLCGISATFVHTLFNLHSKIPTIGASGAIAGVLGAYFLMFPSARVLTLIPFFFFWEIVEIPAFFFLGFWFLYQFMLGVFSLSATGGIAFWAHIGGFVAGMFLLNLFYKKKFVYHRRRRIWI